jgi:hypothetical protein
MNACVSHKRRAANKHPTGSNLGRWRRCVINSGEKIGQENRTRKNLDAGKKASRGLAHMRAPNIASLARP